MLKWLTVLALLALGVFSLEPPTGFVPLLSPDEARPEEPDVLLATEDKAGADAELAARAAAEVAALVSNSDQPIGLGRPLGMQSGAIFDQQLTSSYTYYGSTWHYGPRQARLWNTNGAGGWLSHGGGSEWLQVNLERLTNFGGIATQGMANMGYWCSSYRLEYSLDLKSWTTYTEAQDGAPKVFSGNYDQGTVVTHIFQRPFLARAVRLINMVGPSAGNHVGLRLELYATKSEEWIGGQPMGLSDGTIQNQAFTASSAHGDNWVYYGPQFARLYNTNGWGAWLSQNQAAGEWVTVDLGKERDIGAIATQGAPNGWFTRAYYLSYSRNGATWTQYTESGARRLFEANVDHHTVRKNVLLEPIVARYVRVTVNDFSGYPTLRMEFYAPEHKKHRPGPVLGISTNRISDSAMSASSAHGDNWNYYGPRNARLFGGGDYGSFLPNVNRRGEWVQVDLGRSTEIGAIATQGRKWGGCWWKRYQLLYSNSGTTWTPYMENGADAELVGNTDGNSVVFNIFDSPFVARYVRVVVTDYDNWPCLRMELYAPHPARLNQGKIEDMGEPMGMQSGAIKDTALVASSFYPSDDLACHPRNGRLNNKEGAGAWCSKDNSANEWFQIETDGQIEIGGIATQGRAQDSKLYRGKEQWVTSYSVATSDDGEKFTFIPADDGSKQIFKGNLDSSTVVKNGFAKPVKAKFLRIFPLGYYGHISMRVEIYDTAKRQQELAAAEAARAEAAAAKAQAEKEALEKQLAAEKAARVAAEREAAAAKIKAEQESADAARKEKLAKSDADKEAARREKLEAEKKISAAAAQLTELEARNSAERAKTKAQLQEIATEVSSLEQAVENEKFDKDEERRTLRDITDVEIAIADEKAKILRADSAWSVAQAAAEVEKKKHQILEKRLADIQKEIESEKKKEDEDKTAMIAAAERGVANVNEAAPASTAPIAQ